MPVNKFIIILSMLLSLSVSIDAKLIGAIGFVSPQYPDYGKYRPSQDVDEFFTALIETAYDSYGDAGVSVVNILNMKRGEVLYNDIEYNGFYMIPSEDNRDAIEELYVKRSRRLLKNIAKTNHLDIILYSKFNKAKLRKLLRSKANPATLVYRIFAYDLQSGATKSKYIKIRVDDLFSMPDYDPDELQTNFIEKYITIFQEILGHMKIIGSAYNSEVVKGNPTDNNKSIKETKETTSGDW